MEHERERFANYETLHRLRTPLTVALLAASRLCRLVPLPAPAARLCGYLLTALNQMRDELNELEAQVLREERHQRAAQRVVAGDELPPTRPPS